MFNNAVMVYIISYAIYIYDDAASIPLLNFRATFCVYFFETLSRKNPSRRL